VTYSTAQSADLRSNYGRLADEMQTLMMNGVTQCQPLTNQKAKQQMLHGVGRRLGTIRRSMMKMFELYPPEQTQPLPRETLADLQICLQAYVINLYGVFDNWAWAFVHRHDLLIQVGGRKGVSLFKRETRQFLPGALTDYIQSTVIAWHDDYLKGYRDALAHRIPVYMPPAMWTSADKEEYERLEQEKTNCIRNGEWERLDEVWAQQDVIGKACPTIMHEFSDDPAARAVYLHPQLVCDTGAVVEFGRLFLAHWHELSIPPSAQTSGAEVLNLIQRAKRLAARYRQLTGRPLGIAGEVAEAEVIRLLGGVLAPVRTAGHDVIRQTADGRTERLQVKGRVLLNLGSRRGRLGGIDVENADWDAVLLVLMDLDFNTLEIYESPRARVVEELTREGSRARNERGALSIATFCTPRVSRRLWPVQST
jgi:hypothetical protein